MKLLIVFIVLCVKNIFGLPVPDDRIIFPDDDIEDIVPIKSQQLNDPNILKSENTTEEFLYDERAEIKLENGKYFQGDIILKDGQLEALNNEDEDGILGTRTGLISQKYRWPKNDEGKVIIPYLITEDDYSK